MGNVLVLIVFSLGRVYRGNNFRVIVIILAVIDLICCALILPSEIAKHRNYFNFTSVGLGRAKVFITMWGALSCSLALLVVSVDRYRRACCPLKRQISQSLALQLCAVITFGISVVVAIPGIVIHDIVTNDKTNMYALKRLYTRLQHRCAI
ncbi:hypothetical protein DPMN_039912 [Dreissena polymorpha]|uniref:G-protein coupled receptors family 1 profile domain-containing protein n=1 Tax=Dreissena polymorpha TaxID=45954 RepID=A0A9D4CVP2_DREPO|nr:hypothetical protein DPMN_039912 [Dreissena polymorpha]